MEMQAFIQRLALFLTSWQATTFLIGEYTEGEMRDNPVFTVADGLFWLYQEVERNSIVRKLQIMKLRGQASVPGLHTFRITADGLQAFSRTFGLTGTKGQEPATAAPFHRDSELDEMMGGGIPEGDSLLVAGPSGTGKSVLATQFIAEGLRQGEAGDRRDLRGTPGGVRGAGRQFRPGFRNAAARRKTRNPLPPSPRPFGG